MYNKTMDEWQDFSDYIGSLNCNPIPLEFTNSVNTAEFLHELLTMVKKTMQHCDQNHDGIYSEFEHKFNELSKQLENKFNDVNMLNSILPLIKDFCRDKIAELIGDTLKYVTFELTEDGYFCANIPQLWANDISFDTCFDNENYGKLIIEY